MEITLQIPPDLAGRLRPFENQLSHVFELGLREWSAAGQSGFEGAADVMEILAGLPTPEEVLALRPSPLMQVRIETLLEKNRTEGLTEAEEQEWEKYQYLEHLVRLAKAKAHLKLNLAHRIEERKLLVLAGMFKVPD